jgi:Uma2 family endonuclease
MPNRKHQDLEGSIEAWLREFWVPTSGGKCYHQINVASLGGWPHNYRIPDLVLLAPDRFHVDKNEYFEGGPTVVVEIRSPDDETYEKFDFYASLNVLEIWVIDRDTRQPEIHRLRGSGYEEVAPESAGYRQSTVTNVRMWATTDGRLAMQQAEDTSTLKVLP